MRLLQKRREWDSNPRGLLTLPLFESGTFDHSDISPWPSITYLFFFGKALFLAGSTNFPVPTSSPDPTLHVAAMLAIAVPARREPPPGAGGHRRASAPGAAARCWWPSPCQRARSRRCKQRGEWLAPESWWNLSCFFCPSGGVGPEQAERFLRGCYTECRGFLMSAVCSREKESVSLFTDAHNAGEQAYRLFPALPQTTDLTICDLRMASPEVQLTIASLAGLVNRGPQRLYFIENDDDLFWLSELDASLPRTWPPLTGDDLLARLLTVYRDHLAGLVLYDPALSDTRNVASMLAALSDGLA